MQVKWTKPAANSLATIQDYIAKENPSAACSVTQKIYHSVSQLTNHPELGRAGRVKGTHELIVPGLPFIVPYRIRDKEIHILAVYHTSRKWPESFD